MDLGIDVTMFAHALLSPAALEESLVLRRLKWHMAEYNRIKASRALLDGGVREAALASHKWAIVECEAIARGEEPNWGNEREITEKFLGGNHAAR